MTRYTRRLLLIFLITLFCLAAPTVLFYAWGYSFDWENKKPVLTGGIYLESIPKKADIYINKEFKDKTPRLIKRLAPKEYQVKVVKNDYHSWQKKLKVKSRLVVETSNILLIPQNPSFEIIKNNLNNDFSLEEFLETDEEKQNIIKAEKILSLKEVVSYEISGQDIFYIQKPSYILYKTNLTGAIQEQISLSPLIKNDYQIFISPNQNLAVLDNQGELYIFNYNKKIFENLAGNIKRAQFSKDNKKLLYYSPSEIWVYYLENNLIQPFKKAGEKELITRLSQEIRQAIWYPETNEHLVFSVGSFIKIIELDGRDIRNIIDFLEAETKQITYNQETEALYFIEEEKLYKTSLE